MGTVMVKHTVKDLTWIEWWAKSTRTVGSSVGIRTRVKMTRHVIWYHLFLNR